MTTKEERDAFAGACSKHGVLFERLYYILKEIIEDNNIQLTKEQIKKINAYNTGNIYASEHRDEMAMNNKRFFDYIMEGEEDNILLY